MTNTEQVAAWHREKPDWTLTWGAREWGVAEQVAERLDALLPTTAPVSCELASAGLYCTLEAGHEGECRCFPDEDPDA